MVTKVVSPAVLVPLQEALACAYWYKDDLRAFLRSATGQPELIAQLDWGGGSYKRAIVRQLVTTLAENQHRYFDTLIALILATVEIDPAPLKRLDDGLTKYETATAALNVLRGLVEPYRAMRSEAEAAAQRRRIDHERAKKEQALARETAELHTKFLAMHAQEPQARGYALEGLLNRLFTVYDINAKGPFRIQGEQIDGAFTFAGTDYLLEAKWQKELSTTADLSTFADKVRRKLDNTLGLFLSINGFQPNAIKLSGEGGRRVLLLTEGYDLQLVLDGRIRFDELLRRKREHAARTGEILLRAADILA
ncbi:hypothetical protein [Nocardia salmonicida]|uniref:hypothetical protein n=1 Tax=Nocardia salmonicida TaxID=53431 RepID=UPI0037B400A5